MTNGCLQLITNRLYNTQIPKTLPDQKSALDAGRIHEASLELLSDPGIKMEHEEIRDLFLKNGASPGNGADVVRVPRAGVWPFCRSAEGALFNSPGQRPDEYTHFSSAKGAAIQQPSPTGLGHLTPRDGGLKVRDSLKSMENPRSIRESRTFSPHSSGIYYPALRTISANLIHPYSRENLPEALRILAGGASHRFPANPGSPRQGRSIATKERRGGGGAIWGILCRPCLWC